jgi:hypothetical protein
MKTHIILFSEEKLEQAKQISEHFMGTKFTSLYGLSQQIKFAILKFEMMSPSSEIDHSAYHIYPIKDFVMSFNDKHILNSWYMSYVSVKEYKPIC